jgi:glutaredoxin
MAQLACPRGGFGLRISPRKTAYVWGGTLVLVIFLIGGCHSQPAAWAPNGATSEAPAAVANSYESQLAQHLSTTGSVMYGAYWCPHCADQKALFGDAIDQITYVECAEDGDNAQPQLCQDKQIQGYPTWEIDGQLHPGVKSLDDLATLSGYQPPQ